MTLARKVSPAEIWLWTHILGNHGEESFVRIHQDYQKRNVTGHTRPTALKRIRINLGYCATILSRYSFDTGDWQVARYFSIGTSAGASVSLMATETIKVPKWRKEENSTPISRQALKSRSPFPQKPGWLSWNEYPMSDPNQIS